LYLRGARVGPLTGGESVEVGRTAVGGSTMGRALVRRVMPGGLLSMARARVWRGPIEGAMTGGSIGNAGRTAGLLLAIARALGRRALGSGVLGDGALGRRALDSGALGSGVLGDGALDRRALGSGALGSGVLADGALTDGSTKAKSSAMASALPFSEMAGALSDGAMAAGASENDTALDDDSSVSSGCSSTSSFASILSMCMLMSGSVARGA
jgi:hypothetical protein